MKQKDKERLEAIERLREWLKPCDVVYAVTRGYNSNSGSRKLDFYCLQSRASRKRPSMLYLTYNVSKALGYRLDKEGNLVAPFMNMDQAFQIVYELSRTLFPKHKRPGYALRKEWL